MKTDPAASAARDSNADVEVTRTIAPQESRLGVPAAIGRYRIIRLIGEGGMGAVYEAEQEHPRRTVALKVIRAAWASPEMLRRFEQESQALARLQHPGIAQIYEAGASDPGSGLQPYFAMELIAKGERLTSYANRHKLNVRDRLELMNQVCDAVHHAHQRGIIHRDLKPGNILVDDRGQPKILDFGVARITDSDAQATRQTDLGQLVGTLAYMSPEQASADPLEVDARSDVYALGVILYELLADELPYKLSPKLHEAIITIREQDPAPLTAVSRAYRGDIETIVAKALEKDKARRYGSAADLAADIRRYLRDEPILARPSTTAYQLLKFSRRHRTLVFAIAAVFFVLIAGTAVSTWQAVRAVRAERLASQRRNEAEQARAEALARAREASLAQHLAEQRGAEATRQSATAQKLNDFLVETFQLADPWERTSASDTNGRDLTVAQAMEQSLPKLDSGYFRDQPLVDASLRVAVAESLLYLKNGAAAESQFRKALALQRQYLPPAHADTAATLRKLGKLLGAIQRFDEAETVIKQYRDMSRQVFGTISDDYAYAENNLALIYLETGRLPEAERLLRNQLRIRRAQGRNETRYSDFIEALRVNLGAVLVRSGRAQEAEPLARQVLAEREKRLGEEHPAVAASCIQMSNILRQLGRANEAEAFARRALAINRKVFIDDFKSLTAVVNSLQAQRKFADLDHLYRGLIEEDSGRQGTEGAILRMLLDWAGILLDQKRAAEAEPLAADAVKLARRVVPQDDWRIAEAQSVYGASLAQQGKFAESEPILVQNFGALTTLKDVPAAVRKAALQRIVALYQAWPGKSALLDEWRARLNSDK